MKTVGQLCKQLVDLRPLQIGLVVFAVSFVIRAAFVLHFHTYADPSRTELERTALSLATTGVFGNPYAVTTGPTAHVAPGYTLILAGIFRLFGTGTAAEIVKQMLAAGVVSLLYALLPFAASGLALDRRAGIVAGLVGAIYPARPIVEIKGDWETPYTALALVLLSVLTVRLFAQCNLSRRRALLQGITWGVSLLFVPALLTLFIGYLAAGLLFCRRAGMGRCLSFAVIEVAIVAVCLAPWVIRNQHALGSPVVTRTNFGLELNVSNNDDATPDQRINYAKGVFSKYHPLLSTTEALKVRDVGEVAYNREVGNQAKQWIRTHLGRFLELCLGRARCFWLYYDPTSPVKTAFLGVAVLLGWAGLVQLLRRDRAAGAVVLLILLIYPLPNYLIHVGLRQEYPIHWLMMLLAAACLFQWFEERTNTAMAQSQVQRETASRQGPGLAREQLCRRVSFRRVIALRMFYLREFGSRVFCLRASLRDIPVRC